MSDANMAKPGSVDTRHGWRAVGIFLCEYEGGAGEPKISPRPATVGV